jgi:RHH-type proline utilization regulon transcriptional repressor/proline dehydrogenase/delta 1-pyrroline-5-carboxylate dehydrogenase
MMVRLVKGAYWDAEIKRAQIDGLAGYPVYTRKVYTDVSYLACAKKLLAARDAIYPQFATHNAHSLAAIFHLAAADGRAWQPGDYEFQCLHGMGEPLYDQIVGQAGRHRLVRIYAPVGSHETLLAYLVRRLLENGANTSFVNRIVDERVPVEELIADPVEQAAPLAGAPHPRIALPSDLFGAQRSNSAGIDLASEPVRARIAAALAGSRATPFAAGPIVAGRSAVPADVAPISNPADHGEVVGGVAERRPTTPGTRSPPPARPRPTGPPPRPRCAAIAWSAPPALFEREADTLLALAVREAGKSWANAVAELREAVDFLRYYAQQARGFDAASHVRSARCCASARGTSRSRSSAARSPPRSPPATRCSPSRPSRPR